MNTAAGRERAIPATKSFSGQLLVLELLALLAAEAHNSATQQIVAQHLDQLRALPASIAAQLEDWQQQAKHIAADYAQKSSFLYVGRAAHYAIAREGALKLKESAYVPAEGYPAGELKHGPNALLSADTPLVMLATRDANNADSQLRYERVLQLMRDMRAQGASILAIANAGDEDVQETATYTIVIDAATEPVNTISEVIVLQLLAYYIAIGRGVDVDNPRNLVKAVVAE